jgi:hypothetical protein
MAGGPDQLHTAGVGGVVGSRPGECGQKRVVHVDDRGRVAGDEARRKNLHIARQHHQLNAVPLQQFELPFFGFFARRRGHWHVLEGHAVECRQVLDRAVVRDDEGDLADQLPGPPAVQQIGHAVQVLRAEEAHARSPVARGQLPAHAQLGG